jgi:hypothetical protein
MLPTAFCLLPSAFCLLALIPPPEIEVEPDSKDSDWIVAAGSTVLPEKIGIQHQQLLIRKLHAKCVLVFVPSVVIPIPKEFTGGIRLKAELVYLEGSIYRQFVPVTEVVSSGIPTKLDATAILYEKSRRQHVFGCRLQDHTVLNLCAIDLIGFYKLVAAAYHKVVFVLFVNIVPMSFENPPHPEIKRCSQFPLRERSVFAVVLLGIHQDAQSRL